ncbi:M-phase phosphoprotein 8-like [Ciona intestinalis]
MSEFMKMKVNIQLDEITTKDIEQHHESGEPPCRVDSEVSNAEFRQYIRSNNYGMVFEVLKSKRRMYNLEHQDSMWLTQLMIASTAGFSEIVKILCHYGAKIASSYKTKDSVILD